MQSTMMLAPVFAPIGTKPACLHAAAIWSQGPPLLDAGWRAQVEREQFEQAGQVVERAAPVMGFARLGEN